MSWTKISTFFIYFLLPQQVFTYIVVYTYSKIKSHKKSYKIFDFKSGTFFILVQFEWNVFNMNQINILWSFSSIEASISEIFAIKNCYFLALIFVERSEKLSEKKACDVSVGQVKKSGKLGKTVFFESTWRRNKCGLCSHKPGKNNKFFFKVNCKLWF